VLLLIASIGAFAFIQHSNYKNALPVITYVIAGLAFECLFVYQNYNSIPASTYLYDILFPACMFCSVLVRFNYKFLRVAIAFILTMSVLFLFLDAFDFLAVNYILAISSLLFSAVYQLRNTSPKFIHILEMLIAFGLYLMFLLAFMSYKNHLWESSTLLTQFHTGFVGYLIFTLILINVKLWRHFT
jgi:hypothetical protein